MLRINATPTLDAGDEINRGLVGFWPLNSASGGTAWDISQNKRHGRLTNFGLSAGTGWGNGPLGKHLFFDGTNDYVSVNNVPCPPKITISAWVKCTGANQSFLVSKNFSTTVPFQLSLAPNATYGGFSFYGGPWVCTNVTTDIRNDGKWHLVCGSFDGATLKYFIDGKLDASNTYSGSLPTNTAAMTIGVYLNDGGNFKGAMNALRIHSRALTLAEIQRLYRDPWAGTLKPSLRTYKSSTAYTLSADGIARTYSLGAATFTRGYALAAEGVARRHSFGSAGLSWHPAQVGDTHDGFVRRSRRERALEAAAERARQEWITERNALRLSLEAAMGYAAEVAEGAPDEAVAAVEEATQQARVVLPTLARKPSAVDLAAAVALVERLQTATEEAARLKALAEDDEEVLMLLRAL